MIAKAQYSPHPAAEIFPSMSEAEYEQLKADIVANGLREEIVLYQDQILDGRHRYRACIESGVEPRFRQYEGDDPVKFVLSLNLQRRHLSPSQRAMAAANLATLKRGGDRSKVQNCALTHEQAAKQFSVCKRQVNKASALLKAEESGLAAGLVEQVRRGKMSLNQAEKLVHLGKEQQRECVARSDSHAAVQTGAREPGEQGTRWFDQVASQARRLCSRIEALAEVAEAAGALTPDRRERLLGAWYRARRLLAGDDYEMPIVE